MDLPKSTFSTAYGPLATGGSVTIWSIVLPPPQVCENTGNWPMIMCSSEFWRLKSKRTVCASTTTACLMSAQYERNAGLACLLVSVSKVYFTSCASTGSPLENRASGFKWKLTLSRSGASLMSSASKP